jgi:Raf kinase inhibitor-like YbhB/YbcL family protein
MKIRSTFEHHKDIPVNNTCLGDNVNPVIHISEVPKAAKSLVLIFEDVDAAPRPWTHWMLFNIPVTTYQIKEGSIPEGAVEGLANNHTHGYEGPCPKYFKGTHHYWFRIYALDAMLDLPAATEREEVEEKMKDHIVGKAELLGLCISPEEESTDQL